METIIWGTIVLLITIFAVLFVKKGIRIIPQAEARIVERLGKYHRTIYSGVNYIVPGLDKIKKIPWVIIEETEYGAEGRRTGIRTKIRHVYTEKVDLREQVLDFPAQNVITKDNVTLEIDALLFFQIIEPKKAAYEIDNLPTAIEKLTQTSLRSLIGELELDETLASREIINQKLTASLDDIADKWGVKINRVEIQDILPPDGIKDAMKKQMEAERSRRAAILEAEGEKKSSILTAEGKARSVVLNAEAEAEARLRVAEAEANAIKKVADAIKGNKGDPATYLIAVKYIEALQTMVSGQDNKVIYIPYEATGILSSIGSIKEMLTGTEKKK